MSARLRITGSSSYYNSPAGKGTHPDEERPSLGERQSSADWCSVLERLTCTLDRNQSNC